MIEHRTRGVSDLLIVGPPDLVDGQNAGVFTAPQSIVVFPVATSIVVTSSRAARTIAGLESSPVMVSLVSAGIVGAILFTLTVMDSRARPRDAVGWGIAIVVALLNALLIFAAAVGIEKF